MGTYLYGSEAYKMQEFWSFVIGCVVVIFLGWLLFGGKKE